MTSAKTNSESMLSVSELMQTINIAFSRTNFTGRLVKFVRGKLISMVYINFDALSILPLFVLAEILWLQRCGNNTSKSVLTWARRSHVATT